MKVGYQPHVIIEPTSGDYEVAMRPEVTIVIHGAQGSKPYVGLVDTGADYTLVPVTAAELLGIPLSENRGSEAESFGGHALQTAAGRVVFELPDEQGALKWEATVLFHESENETVLLGHVGFLHYFRALFDGK